jgi:hypothetical protein
MARAPDGNRGSWLFAAVFFAVLLSLSESAWRGWGWRPTVRDLDAIWPLHRAIATSDGDRVILAGASRAQLGLSHRVLRQHFPRKRIANLTGYGRCPNSTIRWLSNERFIEAGDLVIISLLERCLGRESSNEQQELLARSDRPNALERTADAWLGAQLDGRLVSRHPQLGVRRFLYGMVLPETRVVQWLADAKPSREIHARFDTIDLAAHREKEVVARAKARVALSDLEISAEIRSLTAHLDRLVEHGAQVVVVRMPVDEHFWKLDERDYPREQYWDSLAAATRATTIHFQDHRELQAFRLPDGTHLDAAERDAFTARLLEVVERQAPGPER